MPRDLFTSAVLPTTQYPQRRSTLLLSLLAHGAVFAAVVTLSMASAFEGPLVVQRLEGYFAASPPPEPPPPPAERARAALPSSDVIDTAVAPKDAPSIVTPEVEHVPAPMGLGLGAMSTPGVPGGGPAIPITPVAPPPPIPSEMPRVGGDIRPPARLAYVPPDYPAIAVSARVEGEVVLEAVIDETGAVRNAKVITSIPLLDRAAIEAVTKWRYSPTRLNGVAVPVIMIIRVRFALR